jgi:hypothetical protein
MPFKRETKFSIYNEKFKIYDFFMKQTNIFEQDRTEQLNLLNEGLQNKVHDYQKYFTRYEKIANISEIRKKNFHLTEKIENLILNIELLKKIISQKRTDLQMSTSIYNFNRDSFNEKSSEIEKNK